MKRAVYLFLALSTMFACSSDDEGPQFRISINSGGPAYTFQNKEWVEDQYSSSEKSYHSEINIESTDNDTLFHSESFNSPDFNYEIPVPGTGPYLVELHFAEIFHGVENDLGEGARLFSVDIEGGQAALTTYDIYAKAGGPAIAVKESFPNIMVEDGTITLMFTAVEGDAKVSGIEVSGAL